MNTNLERFDLLLAERTKNLPAADADLEVRHVADHLGMGDMRTLEVTLEQVRNFFLAMPEARQRFALDDLEACPW